MSNYYDDAAAKRPSAARTIVRIATAGYRLGRTLDIGCGNGTLLEAAEPHAETVAGIDISDDAIALTRDRVPRATLIRGNAEDPLPFSDENYDSVFLLDVIEHLENPVHALREIRRVLREHGLLIITTPNANSPLRYLRGKHWFGVKDPGHVMLFTAFTLMHLLRSTGFSVKTLHFETFTGMWIDRLLRPLPIGGTLLALAEKQGLR